MKHNGRDSGSAVENECAKRVDKQKDFQRICVPLFMTRVSWQNLGFSTCIGRVKSYTANRRRNRILHSVFRYRCGSFKNADARGELCRAPSQITWKLNFEVSSPLKASCISHATPYTKNMFKFIKKRESYPGLRFYYSASPVEAHKSTFSTIIVRQANNKKRIWNSFILVIELVKQ